MISNHLCRSEVNYNAQVGEVLANVKEMNKVVRLDMPVRQQTN
ncbi:hypothetical protein BTN49_0709 [Candidatus Enterovibrio escicola]|uniref:Mobile element protein n=1 Tax=Candidatus Enterovibrio escicola TaxID=1927127 RepID=A0A2A5T6M0_9GAMM|nr:hypothetical protein BTN49_0709 [Candidatus Enterovibrio escacola]